MTRLNLGCGDKILPNFVNLDMKEGPGIDVVHDLRLPLPFADQTFEFVRADNVLEHLHSPHVIQLINEMYRILQLGGKCEIIVPHFNSQGAVQDPTHVSFFVPRSWLYWNQRASKYGGKFVGITADFDLLEQKVYGNDEERFIRFWLGRSL